MTQKLYSWLWNS